MIAQIAPPPGDLEEDLRATGCAVVDLRGRLLSLHVALCRSYAEDRGQHGWHEQVVGLRPELSRRLLELQSDQQQVLTLIRCLLAAIDSQWATGGWLDEAKRGILRELRRLDALEQGLLQEAYYLDLGGSG